MALEKGMNQGENPEPTIIEKVSGIEGAENLTDVKPIEEAKQGAIPVASFAPASTSIDPPTKGKKMTFAEANALQKANGVNNKQETEPVAPKASGFLDVMASISKANTSVSRPIDQTVDYSKYKDYLSKNGFYFDSNSNLDKARAENQSKVAQAANAVGRVLLNVVPEAIKQTANAFDFEDWADPTANPGNWVSDAMTSIQENVKDALPIYRENPDEALDVRDFAYWMATGESLLTSIGGFVGAGYAIGGVVNTISKAISTSANIAANVTKAVTKSKSFQASIAAAESRGVGEGARGLAVNYLMNKAESIGIGAEVYATVFERQYNNAIVDGKSPEEAAALAKEQASRGAAGAMNFNLVNMLLNTTSSQLFLKSGKAGANLIEKQGLKYFAAETGKESLEEINNDLGQMYGENLDTDTPLSFKMAVNRVTSAEGAETALLGAIGGFGQPALTKAGKYIQSSDNESYMRHFNQYIMENPITPTNKETVIQEATNYAQTQADKDKPMGLFTNRDNAGGQRTSTAQQIDSLYVAQQAALEEYAKASKADNLNDVVNSTISSEFAVDLMNQIQNDDTIPSEQKDNLLERALLSHQAYKSLSVGTFPQLKEVYKTYAGMDEATAKQRGILVDEKEGEPEHYKTKAKRALETLDAYEENYRISKQYPNSTEVYGKLNNAYFNSRDVEEKSEKFNKKIAEADVLSLELFEQDTDPAMLEAYNTIKQTSKIAIHPKLKGSKLEEEIVDLRSAVRLAKKNQLDNTVVLNQITSSKHTRELSELINLYKSKQVAEANKEKTKSSFVKGFTSAFQKGKEAVQRKATKKSNKSASTQAVTRNTKNTSSTGGSQQTTTPAPTSTVSTATTNVKPPTPSTNTNGISFIIPYDIPVGISPIMKTYFESDLDKMTKMVESNFSLETKIEKLKDSIEQKINHDAKNMQAFAPDGEAIVLELVKRYQDKVDEFEASLVSLSPEVIEAKEAYKANIVDFALNLEEDILLSSMEVDEEGNKIQPTKDIVDTKYKIYGSILEQMNNNGIDTRNFEEVMNEFKTTLGSKLTKAEFNVLQALFNFTNNSNETTTYEDLFDTIEDDIDNENRSKRLAKVTLPDGKFVYDIDKESRHAMQATKQTILLNNPNAEVVGLAYPIYNEVGSDKIAYLAQKYTKKVVERTTDDGKNYHYVDKVTAENIINDALDPRVLEADFFVEGASITFMPLESYMDEDGKLVLASTLPVGEKPIGVVINGELIKGLYLHDTTWINMENLNNTADNVEADRAALLKLRERIIGGESVTTTITEVSPGMPITLADDGRATFASEFPTHPVGIVKNRELVTAKGIIEIPAFLSFDEGDVVTKVGSYFHYGTRTNLYAPIRAAISAGLKAFATGRHNEGSQVFLNKTGVSLLKPKGLESYITKFVNTASIKIGESYPTDMDSFKQALSTRPEDEVVINFIKGAFYIGRGGAIDVYTIDPNSFKDNLDSLDIILSEIDTLLLESYANVDLGSLKSNEALIVINEKGLEKEIPTYEEYVKTVSMSSYGSITLPSGENITTIQKRVTFATEGVADSSENVPSAVVKTKKPRVKRKAEKITTPTGEQQVIEFGKETVEDSFDFDNIDMNFSPMTIEDVETYLTPLDEAPLTSPSLIPGIPNHLQEVIIQDIVLDYYGRMLEAKKTKTGILTVDELFDKKIELFNKVLIAAYAKRVPSHSKMEEQVANIVASKAKFLEIVKQDLTSKLGVKINKGALTIENTNDEATSTLENVDAPDGEEPDDTSERSRIYDANEFGIDPKLDLSNAIKYLLYGVIDATVDYVNEPYEVEINGEIVKRIKSQPYINPRRIPLQLPIYVNPDVVYQDMLKLFSKSSMNDGMDTTAHVPNKDDALLHPKIQMAIAVLTSKYLVKPYYANVVTKLRAMDSQTQLQFIKAFNKNNTDHITILEMLDKDGERLSLRPIKNSTQNAVLQLQQKWVTDLKAAGGYITTNDITSLNPDKHSIFINLYNKMAGDKDIQTYTNFADLFSVIGITLSEPAFNKLRGGVFINGRVRNLNQQFESTDGYLKRMKNRVEYIMKGGKDGTALPVEALFADKVFAELANFLLDFDKTVFNTSYRNINGDTIWGVTNNRYFMERFISLKTNARLLKDLANNPFSSTSSWLKDLYNHDTGAINKSDERLDFTYNTLDGYKVKETNKSKSVDSLNRKELIQLTLSLFYNNGETRLKGEVPVHKFVIPALSDKSNMFTVQARGRFYTFTNNTFADSDIKYLRSQLFEGEYNRIIYSQGKGAIGKKGYDSGSSKFLMLPLFNNIKGLFVDGAINVNALTPNHPDNIEAKINDVIMQYVKDQYIKTYNDWDKLGLLSKGKVGEYEDKMNFIDTAYADASNNNSKQNLQEASSVALNYSINYLVANANMQMLMFNDPAFFYKKGKMNDARTEEITTDIAETWDNATKRYAAVNGGKDDFGFPAGSKFNILTINDTKQVSSRYDYLSQLWAGHPQRESILADYSDMEPGDGQEYTSLEEHLDRMVYGTTMARDTADRILKTYKQTGKVAKSDLDILLIPFKPLYFNTYMAESGVMETLYIKTSSFPLIKELTKGTDLDVLREYMDNSKNNVRVAVFASGIKAGNPTASLELFNKDGSIIDGALKGDISAHIIKNVPREGHGNQQSNPDKSSKQIINDGTQQAKLLFTNILDVLGFKNPFSNSDDNTTISGRELATMYLNRYEKRFQIQHQKLMKELDVKNGVITNVAKLKKILTEEALGRGWTFNEASSFELDAAGLNFEIPLWMSISSSKIESLLSAIVDNRVRKRKRFGRSYILASDAGIRTFNKAIDNKNSGIVFTSDFTGSLNNSYGEKGVVTSAEILVPFRFFDNEGNLLNIKNFLKEDGTVDTTKLPENLLEGFGYRIPTSGINLMSNIKVVGFLPESYGDAIIAPADFTKQMGSDFDVDKFYSNSYATYYNKDTGILEKLTNKHLDIKASISKDLFGLRGEIKRLSKYKGKNKDSLIEKVKANIKEKQSNPIYKIKDLDILVLDNELTEIQRAVLNNATKEVQRARTKPLSFGRLQEMIDKFGEKTSDAYYTFLSRSTQDVNYLSGNLGKTAVGNFSLDMILNSLGQYAKNPLYFRNRIETANGVKYKKAFMSAFGYKSNNINDPYLNDKSGRYKSDVLEGLMAAALDNGKEQILGKLGIGSNTFDFIRGMISIGFNEEVIMGILAQPLVKSYLDPDINFKLKSAITTAYYTISNQDNVLFETDINLLQSGVESFKEYSTNPDALITALENVSKPDAEVSSTMLLQLQSLSFFTSMERRGQALSQIRSALNVDSAGVGKNIIYSEGKLQQADAAMSISGINNPSAYFNGTKLNEDTDLYEKEYSAIGNSALYYGAATNSKLWSKYFPFANPVMDKLIKNIAFNTGKDIFRLNSYSDYATLVLKDFKSFLGSKKLTNALPFFMKKLSSKDIYKYVVHSTPTHDSLGEFIINLRDNAFSNIKYTNALLDTLLIDPVDKQNTSEAKPAIVNIGYTSIDRVDNSENKIVNAFVEMINTPVPLGLWNGEAIDSKDLANLLIAHQMMSKGIPSATKFIQFIPTEQLKRLGYYNQMSETYRDFIEPGTTVTNVNYATMFLLQHLQHNMADYYDRRVANAYQEYFTDGVFTAETTEGMPKYIVFKDDKGYHVQHRAEQGYIRLNPLGWGNNTEYNTEIANPISINPINNTNMVNVNEVKKVNKQTIIENSTVEIPNTTLIDSTLGKQITMEVVMGEVEETGEPIIKDFKAYRITMTSNGTPNQYFLLKNGNTYNTIHHPLTGLNILIEGLSASSTKLERDSLIMKALATLPVEELSSLGLSEEVEIISIEAIENNIDEFMTPSRDRTDDVYPIDMNITSLDFADQLGLSDTTLNLEDKYRLVFDKIRETVGETTPLGYFLTVARDILPLLGNVPIIIDTTLKAKGVFKGEVGDGYIVINPNNFTTVQDMANVIAHEAIHALFKKQIRVNNPIVKDLEKLRKEVEKELIAEYGQEAIDTMKDKVRRREPLIKGVESELLYPLLNIDEFLTGVLTNPAFQTYLNSKDINLVKKTMWEKLLEVLTGILNVIGIKTDSKFADAMGGVLALTKDIRDNHMKNIPKAKYQRSLDFINEKFNLVSDTNTLNRKGNAQEIVDFINDNFANTIATLVNDDYVQLMPIVELNADIGGANLSPDDWDLSNLGLELEQNIENNAIRGNYYQYAATLRERVIQGETALKKAKISGNIDAIEIASEELMKDKLSLINIPKLQTLKDFELKAKEDLDKVNKTLANPMSSEDITYSRNILNFWTKVREFTFTDKHRESESLMRIYGIIEDMANDAVTKLEQIERTHLEDFIKDTLGRDVNLNDVFKNYKDIGAVVGNVRDISTYDNALLNAIWKKVQMANMEAEAEAETLLSKLTSIIDKVMPKLKAINPKSPYEIFRQLSENGLKTNHLINAYSTKFYNDRSRAYGFAKDSQTHSAVNNYANWVSANTKVLKLEDYFPADNVISPNVEEARETLRAEVGDYVYNIWFNGQNRKINSYNRRKEVVMAKIKSDMGLDSSVNINSNEKALNAIKNWAKKHSPYEFSKVVNSGTYKYYDGSVGIDGFQGYEVMPNQAKHLNKDFEVIATDPELLAFYDEFSEIYETLKAYVPASQFSSLIQGGLPVIEQSIYQAFSTKGLKAGFKSIKTAWNKSLTSTYKDGTVGELDIVTGQNKKEMHIPGIKSNADYILNYVKSESLNYELTTGNLPTLEIKAQFREEAVNNVASSGDFDLGKLMKVFGTLVIAHKQIAAIEDLIKIAQYTINSYEEYEVNPDGSNAQRSNGGRATLPSTSSFINTKKSLTYFIDSVVYGNVKDEEGKTNKKLLTEKEKEIKASYEDALVNLDDRYGANLITEEAYNEYKTVILSNIDKLGSNIVLSKVGDNWLKYVQLKLMGWNILGGFSNSAFGFIGNMIEAAGEGAFTLSEMTSAYKATTASVAKNLSFNKWAPGESSKIRNAMDGMNVLKEASHELFTANDASTFEGAFKFASPYNMNQRTEYLNQAPIMILLAKKTMVDTIGGRISIWDGMDENWEWDTATYGPMPTKVILDMRIAINKHIQRIHGNYDPMSPLMIKKKITGRAVSQFRTWLYESVATRFEKERYEDAIGATVKGRYRTLGGIIFENDGRLNIKDGGIEFTKALINNFTFGALKLKSFQNTNLSEIDAQNMRKIAMELVLLLDVYILIALLKAGLSDDDEKSKALYNMMLNQGTRLKSDLLLYVNPSEARNILKDIIPSASLYDDIANFAKSMTVYGDDDIIGSGVNKGNSRKGTATMKLIPFTSKAYSISNSANQIFDKDIKIDKED